MTPIIAVSDHVVIAGLEMASVEAAIKRSGTSSSELASSQNYVNAAHALPEPDQAFGYIDTALLYARFDATLRPMLLMGAMFLPKVAEYVDLSKWPPADVITKHLSPVVTSTYYKNDGYVTESIGPVTFTQAAVGAGAIVGASVMAYKHQGQLGGMKGTPPAPPFTQPAPCRASPHTHARGNAVIESVWHGRERLPVSLLDVFTTRRENCCENRQRCYYPLSMAILKKNAFSRRVPDLVTEELVAVLSRRASFEFKQLFDIVHENLRARNAASGGEEMLRLRAYEKLQNLVARGAVKKNAKSTRGFHRLWRRRSLLRMDIFPGALARRPRRDNQSGPGANRSVEEGR